MDTTIAINKILRKGTFKSSFHHPIKPKKIDDETYWMPLKSGRITKGYFKGYDYDAKRKLVLDKGKIIERI